MFSGQINNRYNGYYAKILRTVLNISSKHYLTKTAVRPLTSHLTNHIGKANKTCWGQLVKLGRTQASFSLFDSYNWIGQSCQTYNDLHTSDQCREWMKSKNPAGVVSSGDWWQERVKKETKNAVLSAQSWWCDYIYISIYIYIYIYIYICVCVCVCVCVCACVCVCVCVWLYIYIYIPGHWPNE